MEPYWSETVNGHASHSVKYESEAAVSSFPYCTESSLNFSASATTYSEDDAEYTTGRRNKTSRQDPLSHRIIEKRRRDRMNSCLADLSRLIPPQYQRKGRGRIEKTEIIEMAIRHLKHLQNECLQKENDYRMGYSDCMKEAAKFLYDSQMQEFCYRLLTRLQEHCDEVMKNDCIKSRNCHALSDNVSASSGSPPHAYNQPMAPLCQLRDMLVASDLEQSNDHSDIKDLSFRNHLNQLHKNALNGSACNANESSSNSINSINNNNNNASINPVVNNGHRSVAGNNNAATSTTSSTSPLSDGTSKTDDNGKPNRNGNDSNNNNVSQQPNQAPVITSTAPSSMYHHTDSSNHDFDSSHEQLLQTDASNMHSPPPREQALHHQHHHHHHPLQQSHHATESMLIHSSRLRNFSESSHDIEHNNNNYKYKNYIKERFNHELHDEETTSEHYVAPPLLQSEHSHTHSMSEHSKDGTEPDVAPIIAKKRKLAESNHAGIGPLDDTDSHLVPPIRSAASSTMLLGSGGGNGGVDGSDEKPKFCFGDIKIEPRCGSHKLHFTSLPHSNGLAATTPSHRSFAVPIFALHGQGTYYVPLNVDYSALVPFLNGLDLLEKNYSHTTVVHPININVNFVPPNPSASLLVAAAAAAVAAGKQQQQPPPMNCSVSNAVASATTTKTKLEAITNGW